MIPGPYTPVQFVCIGFCVFLMGVTKGGIPVGPIALPLLILVWPDQMSAARNVVGFMLPLLCVMDVFAFFFYRRHVLWSRIVPLVPGTLVGVFLTSLLFLSEDTLVVAVSDRWLKLLVGLIGVGFVAYQAGRRWIFAHLPATRQSSRPRDWGFGLAAGSTSTLAHAAGPVAQMYYLPQGLEKMQLAGTMVAYFFGLNLVKLVPFALLGRLGRENLLLGAIMLPLIPAGVGCGYLIVRTMKHHSYIAMIYVVLLVTSLILVAKAIHP